MYELPSLEPVWLDLATVGGPPVKVQVRPIEPKAIRAARRAASAEAGGAIDPDAIDAAFLEDVGEAFSNELIRRGIIAWEGIGESKGGPVEPTPARIEAFLRDPSLQDAVEILYIAPWLARNREKNGSALSSNGTSEGATADRPTVRTAARKAAKPAPTTKTSRKPTPARRPGKS